ncbi:MAG: HAMP domain-containing sensor histidine kinase [Acidimicrobiia bacterium]
MIALTAAIVAVRHQADLTRPVGEGELFTHDAGMAADLLSGALDPSRAVREARNALRIEAVSLLDDNLTFIASSSGNLVGSSLDTPFFGGNPMPLRALAAPIGLPVLIDGIEEWPADAVLYQVMRPLDDGRIAVLLYDLQELTERRAIPRGIHPETLQLAGVAMFFGVMTLVLAAGRAGAHRRVRRSIEESAALQARARELATHNEELDEARSAAERALALAEEKNRIRSEFVLMINHELNTPLTGVVTSAELLATHPEMPAADRGQLLADMVREGDKLRGLIDRMLTVARIENQGLGYSLRRIEAATLVELLRPATQTGTLVAPAAIAVMTDPEGLVALVASLTENARTHGAKTVAVDFLETLPFEPDLIVGTPANAGMWVAVRDDGPGIDQEFLPRIFEKFEKRSDSPGTGLGLYLARLIAEAIGASIAVKSGPDGTTMAVGVALAREAAAA